MPEELIASFEQPAETGFAQIPLKISTTGLKFPIGLTIIVSLEVAGAKANHTSAAIPAGVAPQAAGGNVWVALLFENV
jgi:hypothetical protein